MGQILFTKYHGTGNDFILIDNRSRSIDTNQVVLFAAMCHRRFGIGADGVIFLQTHQNPNYSFEMVYLNADGRPSSMCGNGGRCIVAFAQTLDLVQYDQAFTFLAIDGEHEAVIYANDVVALKMQDVSTIQQHKNDYVLDTGSPHYVRFVEEYANIDVFEAGRAIRYSADFQEAGINVNFVCIKDNGLQVATYERGVEAETYSCGTGVVASGIAAFRATKINQTLAIPISTKGGELMVRFQENSAGGFEEIWLEGPTCTVFSGVWNS
ncbi:MAG: diaminopimelate epimerase [Chitinophagales bacterium]